MGLDECPDQLRGYDKKGKLVQNDWLPWSLDMVDTRIRKVTVAYNDGEKGKT